MVAIVPFCAFTEIGRRPGVHRRQAMFFYPKEPRLEP